MFGAPPLPSFSNPLSSLLGGGAVKLSIVPEESPDIEFMFNPTQFSLDRATSWEDTKPVKESYGILHFTGGSSDTLAFTVMIDKSEESGGDVLPDIQALYDLTLATVSTSNGEYMRPELVQVVWKEFKFVGGITSLKVEFTMFAETGEPLRADVSMTLIGRAFTDDIDAEAFFKPFSAG